MHELSIAVSLIDAVRQEAARRGAERVDRVFVRIGALSGVVADALAFSFDVAAVGTCVAGARLEIEAVPIVTFCPACQAETTPPAAFDLRCPTCGTPTPDVRQGRELELTAIEIPEMVER